MKTTLLLAILVTSVVIVVTETSQTSESSKERSLTSVMVNVDEKGQISPRALSTWRDFLNRQESLSRSRVYSNIGAGLAIMAMIASSAVAAVATLFVSVLRPGKKGGPVDATLIPIVLSIVMLPGFLLYELYCMKTVVSALLFRKKGFQSRSLHFLKPSPLVEDFAVIFEKVVTALDNVDRK